MPDPWANHMQPFSLAPFCMCYMTKSTTCDRQVLLHNSCTCSRLNSKPGSGVADYTDTPRRDSLVEVAFPILTSFSLNTHIYARSLVSSGNTTSTDEEGSQAPRATAVHPLARLRILPSTEKCIFGQSVLKKLVMFFTVWLSQGAANRLAAVVVPPLPLPRFGGSRFFRRRHLDWYLPNVTPCSVFLSCVSPTNIHIIICVSRPLSRDAPVST